MLIYQDATSLTSIGASAFRESFELTSITLPATEILTGFTTVRVAVERRTP